jgi:hypothetical protein
LGWCERDFFEGFVGFEEVELFGEVAGFGDLAVGEIDVMRSRGYCWWA